MRDILPYLPKKINFKEITEVMGMWNFVREDIRSWKPDVILDVGSGKYSTLGVFLAFNQKIDVYCIDPREDIVCHTGINRFWVIKHGLEDFGIHFRADARVMVLCNHSHIKHGVVLSFLSGIDNWIYATNPCCHDNRIPNVVCEHKYDTHIWSEKRNLYKYRSK